MTTLVLADPITLLQHAPHDPAALEALAAQYQDDLIVWLPAGASLLLPSSPGIVRHLTPQVETRRVDAAAKTWWVLISPTVQALAAAVDDAPPLPEARG